MENLEGIRTVQDLLNAQETDKPYDKDDVAQSHLDEIYKEDPQVGLEIACHIVGSLIGLHESMIKAIAESDEPNLEVAAAWHKDAIQLTNALMLMKSVKL